MATKGMRLKSTKEVFPLAHVCNDTNKMTLINPQGAKLNIYKQKVEQAIQSYEKRLNKIVWRALSQEEKEKLDANKPIQYLENKTVLNQALERLNWPISSKELSMLESEILAGKMYIQQAMELQEAAKNYANKAPGEQQKLQGNPTKTTKSKRPDPLKGQKVIARCDENGFYFPGVVKKCVSCTQALVGFRYGDTKVVSTSFIMPVGGAMPCPLLQEFCPRSALIKISQNKYALSCSHIKSPPIPEDPEVERVEARNSAFLFWPLKADTQDSGEPRREKPRRKKRPAKQPLQQAAPSDSDGSSHGTSSHGSYQGTHPEPKTAHLHFPAAGHLGLSSHAIIATPPPRAALPCTLQATHSSKGLRSVPETP
uniref:von Willebrand factor A domain containing 3B n=1 Tax=Nomascus leucogenys TaxID=61853 RepID=A0A2I3GPR4_NOMLE